MNFMMVQTVSLYDHWIAQKIGFKGREFFFCELQKRNNQLKYLRRILAMFSKS